MLSKGLEIPMAPADVEAIPATLAALIDVLAQAHVYLQETEHLTDEQLVAHLLRAIDEPDCPPSNPFFGLSSEELLAQVPESIRDGSETTTKLLEELEPLTRCPDYPVMTLEMLGDEHCETFDMRSYLVFYASREERESYLGHLPKRLKRPGKGRDATLPAPGDFLGGDD